MNVNNSIRVAVLLQWIGHSLWYVGEPFYLMYRLFGRASKFFRKAASRRLDAEIKRLREGDRYGG